MSAQHTAGPWVFVEMSAGAEVRLKRRHWRVGRAVADHTGVALVFGDDEANACLIAAAPDLLAFAKQVAAECAMCEGTGNSGNLDTGDQHCSDCWDARAVIARAEGKS